MISEIGSYQAKVHLSEYLERVRQGESFYISRHGKPIAELKPVEPDDLAKALAGCTVLRSRLSAVHGELSVAEIVREDRNR